MNRMLWPTELRRHDFLYYSEWKRRCQGLFESNFAYNPVMKRLFALFVIFVSVGCGSAPAEAVPPSIELSEPLFCVALDYGHGGFDGGAVGVETGVVEAELNYAVGELVREGLIKNNVWVVLTRTDGEALGDTKNEDMHNRGEILCGEQIDLVVSVHMNKFSNRSVRGPMVYYQAGAEAGERLAQSLMDALTEATGRNPRLASAGNNFVTRVPAAPAALVECGFLSHSEEERLLQNSDYQQLVADAIVEGIMNYYLNLCGETP